MSFLNPLLLYLLPLAAIPILLHLLTLHRLRTIELPTYRFLFDSYVQQRRRMQFLEALLAMLRTLFLLGLVAMLARPVMQHWGGLFQTGSGRDVILLVDCSASMNTRTGGVPAIDRARSAALSIVEHLGRDDRLTLVRVGSKPEEIFSRFSTDMKVIRDRIEELKTSPSRGNLFAALQHVFGPDAPKRSNALVYLFTDCQASGWREIKGQATERLIPADTQFVVVNVGSAEPVPNLAVLGDPPPRQRAVAGLPLVLRARVLNSSKTEPADPTLSLFIDEKEVYRSLVPLKPGEIATREVIHVPAEPGLHRARFEITGKSPDRFPDDDRYLFALAIVPRVKVILVNGNPQADPQESETLYLKAALTVDRESETPGEKKPGEKQPGGAAATKELQRSLEVIEVQETALTAEMLKDASVVVLANCGAINATHCTALREFVTRGGGLIMLPGDRVNPDLYNGTLFPVPNGVPGDQLTSVKLAPAEGDPEKVETFERFAVLDYSHPALAVFEDPEARFLKTVRFFRRFKLQMPEKRDATWSLAEFGSGSPALVEAKHGDGILVIAAFPANVRWTNLPLKPEFVAMMLRLVTHVQRRPELEVPSVVAADSPAEVSVSGSWGPVSGKVSDAAGRTGPPLTFERSGSWLMAAYERTSEPGYYSVEIKGGPGGAGKAGAGAFAVNLAPEESDFGLLSEKGMQDLLPSAQLKLVDASAETQQLYGGLGDRQEVWRPVIGLLLVVIVVEFLLATLGGRRKAAEENLTLSERVQQYNPGAWIGRMTGAGSKE